MMKTENGVSKLERAVSIVAEEVEKIQQNISWNQLSEDELWYELIACMLGSGVTFEHAQGVATSLRDAGLLYMEDDPQSTDEYEERLYSVLNSPAHPPLRKDGMGRRYRYPRVRASYICRTAKDIYSRGESLKEILESADSATDCRNAIISKAFGIGPKQASLFLRNIGYADDLAILDSHVLKFMLLCGMTTEIKSQSNINSYEKIETSLRQYADQMDAKLAHLDTAIWVVMRIYNRNANL
jgi:N-glycosylase/DNA lyase